MTTDGMVLYDVMVYATRMLILWLAKWILLLALDFIVKVWSKFLAKVGMVSEDQLNRGLDPQLF